MTLWCVTTPERRDKTTVIMSALAHGWPDARIIEGTPPDDGTPFVIWGHLWNALDLIPAAIRERRPFWHIDNGFYKSAGGTQVGYYRIAYRGICATSLNDPPAERADQIGAIFQPWRIRGGHIVIAMPGENYGRCIGLNMADWIERIEARVRRHTRRPIIVRRKRDAKSNPIARDLSGAWALVTHSSNAAIDAVRAGIPVFCEPTCAAAPVGNIDLANIDDPARPPRESWWRSLMCQQFTLDEMRDGTAYEYLRRVRKQVDRADG